MAKIPTVTPKRDKVVRVILDCSACQAKRKLSYICRKNFIIASLSRFLTPCFEFQKLTGNYLAQKQISIKGVLSV